MLALDICPQIKLFLDLVTKGILELPNINPINNISIEKKMPTEIKSVR